MKIAFISDIHSNFYALESVINSIKNEKIETIYNLGDIVGYHSMPNEVINLLKKNNVESILGNHDFDIINKKFTEEITDIKYWTYKNLTQENLDYLKKLPLNKEIEILGYKIKIVHGSSKNIVEYVFENSKIMEREINDLKEDILICGHTHYPYVKTINNKTIVNTGSVGKPKIGKPTPSYIVLNIEENNYNFETKFVEYDLEKAMKDMKNKGLSEKTIKEMKLGRIVSEK